MNPVLRIVFISISTIIGLFLAVLALRTIGLNQPPITPLLPKSLQTSNISIIYASEGQHQALAHMSPSEFIAIPIKRTKDGRFIIFTEEHLKALTGTDSFVMQNNLSDLTQLKYLKSKRPLLSLKSFLKTHPKDKVLFLDLIERDPAKYFGLPQALSKANINTDLVVFFSPFTGPLKYMKRELPRSLFAANVAKIGKLLFMTSLYIEPLASIDSDLLIAPITYRNKPMFPERLAKELTRRKLPIILTSPPENTPENIRHLVNGYLTKEAP